MMLSLYTSSQEETCVCQTHRSLETTTLKQNHHLLHYTPTLPFVQNAIHIKHPTLPEQHLSRVLGHGQIQKNAF
jgi:hypothetical protein